MTHERLTCLVPTHNRPHFLRRLFRFYAQFPPGFPFLVVDSSNPAAASENREVIESARGSLDIDYRHFAMNFTDKCVEGLGQIRSLFTVFCADDDLLFPEAVWRSVEFLGNAPGFASAMGRTAMLNVNQPPWWCKVLKGYSIEDDRPFDRCRRMAREWFSNFYAVHRTATLLDTFQITVANTDFQESAHLSEGLLSQLSVLRGRVKVLPQMYSLREQHGANTGTTIRNQGRPEAERHYLQFRGCLTDQIERTGIDRADAERFIDEIYGIYRDPNLVQLRRRRSVVEVIRQVFHGISQRAADFFWTDRTRHRRLVRAGDLVGCETQWRVASQLIREFPRGMAAEDSRLKRCA